MSASTIVWRVTPEEHVRAVAALQQYHAKRERRVTRELRMLALAIVALAAAGMLVSIRVRTGRAPVVQAAVLAVAAVISTAWIATRPLALRRAARRQLRENPLAMQERRYTFDSFGVKIAGETFADNYPWREIRHIGETPEFFLIFTQRSAYYLPKRAIVWPDSLESLREVFLSAVGERAGVR